MSPHLTALRAAIYRALVLAGRPLSQAEIAEALGRPGPGGLREPLDGMVAIGWLREVPTYVWTGPRLEPSGEPVPPRPSRAPRTAPSDVLRRERDLESILAALRGVESLTRREITQRTGLSYDRATYLVRQLAREGLVRIQLGSGPRRSRWGPEPERISIVEPSEPEGE